MIIEIIVGIIIGFILGRTKLEPNQGEVSGLGTVYLSLIDSIRFFKEKLKERKRK